VILKKAKNQQLKLGFFTICSTSSTASLFQYLRQPCNQKTSSSNLLCLLLAFVFKVPWLLLLFALVVGETESVNRPATRFIAANSRRRRERINMFAPRTETHSPPLQVVVQGRETRKKRKKLCLHTPQRCINDICQPKGKGGKPKVFSVCALMYRFVHSVSNLNDCYKK